MAKTESQNKFSLGSFIEFINNNFTLIIVFLIVIILGFLGGSLWTENQLLKSNNLIGSNEQDSEPNDIEDIDNYLSLDEVPAFNEKDHYRGSENAEITMITYSDYECPFCNRWHPTFNSLVEKYSDQITFVYRHFPLSFHAHADILAQASECVADYAGEKAFWQFTDKVYERMADQSIFTAEGESSIITEDTILTMAANAGASQTQVQECLDSKEKAAVVNEMVSGATGAGIGGTPSTIIISEKAGRELVPGAIPLAEVEVMLEKHL
jgi:protein-disulfide isomerase